jgi:hypothetical protein
VIPESQVNELARETGAVRRRRQVRIYELVWVLVDEGELGRHPPKHRAAEGQDVRSVRRWAPHRGLGRHRVVLVCSGEQADRPEPHGRSVDGEDDSEQDEGETGTGHEGRSARSGTAQRA